MKYKWEYFPRYDIFQFMSTKNNSTEASILPKALMNAVRKVLRPLVRLLLSYRIVFPQLSEILKSVYVEVANEYFRLDDKNQTDTRLSLLTGIHRKDIKRLRNQDETDSKTPENVDISTRIISKWIAEKNYLDKNKKPLVLPLQADKNKPSFEALVHDVCKQDIRPRVVLDEWLRLGVVTIEDEHLTLNAEAFIPSKGFDEKAFFFGHNIADHVSASTQNLLEEESPYFERCVYYDGLSEDSIKQLEEIIATKGMETLLAVNELAIQLKAQDIANPINNKRINIGLYAYHEFEVKKND